MSTRRPHVRHASPDLIQEQAWPNSPWRPMFQLLYVLALLYRCVLGYLDNKNLCYIS